MTAPQQCSSLWRRGSLGTPALGTPKASKGGLGSSCHYWPGRGPGLGLHQPRGAGESRKAPSNPLGCVQPGFYGSGAISQRANRGWGRPGDLASLPGSASCWLCGPGHVCLSSPSLHFPTSEHGRSAELNNRCTSSSMVVGIYYNGFSLVYFLLQITWLASKNKQIKSKINCKRNRSS